MVTGTNRAAGWMLAVVRASTIVVLTAVHNFHLNSWTIWKIRTTAGGKMLNNQKVRTLKQILLTVALFPVRPQLVGSVANARVRARRVTAAVCAVIFFCLTLIDIWGKTQQYKPVKECFWSIEGASSIIQSHLQFSSDDSICKFVQAFWKCILNLTIQHAIWDSKMQMQRLLIYKLKMKNYNWISQIKK